MTDIDVLGITTRREIKWGSGFCIMGFGDVALPQMEITLRGCALARSSGRIIALPPKLPGAHPGDLGAIQWNANGKFAMRVRDALLAAYRKMGGEMPPDRDEPFNRRDHVTGKPIGPDPWEAEHARADELIAQTRETIARRKTRPDDMPADALEQAEKAAAQARRHAVARTADEDDDTSGLHRTLGICAVEETMERAGL